MLTVRFEERVEDPKPDELPMARVKSDENRTEARTGGWCKTLG